MEAGKWAWPKQASRQTQEKQTSRANKILKKKHSCKTQEISMDKITSSASIIMLKDE